MRRTLLGLVAGVLALGGFAWSTTPARADHYEHHGWYRGRGWDHDWHRHYYRPWYGGRYYTPYYGGGYSYAPYRSYYYAPYPSYYYGGFGYQGPNFGFYVR